MAIPFYEPKNADAVNSSGDQVDGPAPAMQPTAITLPTHATTNSVELDIDEIDFEMPTTSTNVNVAAATQTAATNGAEFSTQEQLMAWKMLALAMCNTLKQYYLKNGNTKNAFSSSLSVQLLQNGQIKPMWK